jgi:hypothetical protein
VFSVTGIAALFAGASLSAGIMASALEAGKIVSISFLYQYWKEIPKTLKYYLSVSSVVLMLITSAGIYGYLSSAYAKVAAEPLQLSAQIQTVSTRASSVNEDIDRKTQRLNQLISLRSQQETRLDQLVSRSTTGNNSTIRSAQTALTNADRSVNQLQKEISELSVQRDSLNAIGTQKQVEIETNGDIGTFVYIAKILGTDLDTVVKWFTLIIVLVFDPLAVALVIAVNFLIKTDKENTIPISASNEDDKTEPYKVYEPQVVMETASLQETETSQLANQSTLPETPSTIPKTRIDPQYFTRGDFDWSNIHLWQNDPNAVTYYNERIKSRLKST